VPESEAVLNKMKVNNTTKNGKWLMECVEKHVV
jgi:hypothetical protein